MAVNFSITMKYYSNSLFSQFWTSKITLLFFYLKSVFSLKSSYIYRPKLTRHVFLLSLSLYPIVITIVIEIIGIFVHVFCITATMSKTAVFVIGILHTSMLSLYGSVKSSLGAVLHTVKCVFCGSAVLLLLLSVTLQFMY